MEADWEFEVGDDAPVIEACWPGFVDLRADPGRVTELSETHRLLALADALARLNATSSPVWSSKVDVFVPGSIDPDELDAPPEEMTCAIACYIDLHWRNVQQWNSPFTVEQFCKESCSRLKTTPLRCCRVDLVIRRAHHQSERNCFAVTAYLTACGASETDAHSKLAECLDAVAVVIVLGLE